MARLTLLVLTIAIVVGGMEGFYALAEGYDKAWDTAHQGVEVVGQVDVEDQKNT